MKSKMSWKGVLISLSVLILFVGLYGMAIGNISFPYTFTAGTAAKASEVNANFAAVNLRQAASAASMAGDFYVKNLEIYRTAAPIQGNIALLYRPANCNCMCSSTFQGTLTLASDGKVTGSGMTTEQCQCVETCCIYTYNISITGTYTVSSDGSGVLDLTYVQDPGAKTSITYDRTFAFQASKDLNTLIINATDDKNSLGTGLRK